MSHILHKLEEQNKGSRGGSGEQALNSCHCALTLLSSSRGQCLAPQPTQSHSAPEGLGCRREEASQQQRCARRLGQRKSWAWTAFREGSPLKLRCVNQPLDHQIGELMLHQPAFSKGACRLLEHRSQALCSELRDTLSNQTQSLAIQSPCVCRDPAK